MRAELYHGTDREVVTPGAADVLLTSYGVLRNDVDRLAAVRFGLVIFDEIQSILGLQSGPVDQRGVIADSTGSGD